MTREESKKAAEVMLAYADGKEMEFGKLISNNSTDESFEAHSLCFLISFLNRTSFILL